MPTKLNQIVAVVQGRKARAQKVLTEAHHRWKPEAISGITKTYEPKDEDGDRLPSESKQIHLDVRERIRDTMEQAIEFWDAVVTQEHGNTLAMAEPKVDSLTLGEQPVPVLLFLQKQLVDLHTFVSQLPVLPADREWSFDTNRNCYVTEPVESLRTAKVPQVLLKSEATEKHPAQTEVWLRDVAVGTWTTTHMSSAIPAKKRAEILRRIEALQDAVKIARETANATEIAQKQLGRSLVDYVFGDLFTE